MYKLKLMKFVVMLMLLFFSGMMCGNLQAQQKHFIYIESEDRQPFAVVLNGKVYSSSDYGYVIVPKLTDGTYSFTVSFPLNKFPDQNFKCIINKKDAGYKLENNAGKGWSLQNMQTQKIVAGNSGATEDNAFTNMLSDVVGDSNLTKKNIPANTFKQDTVTASSNTIDITAMASSTNNATAISSTNNFITDSTQPQKISETKLDTGTNMVFVDKTSGTDTIHVFVPAEKATVNSVASTNDSSQHQQSEVTLNNNVQTSSEITDTTTHTINNPFYKSSDQNQNNNVIPQVNASPAPAANTNTSSGTNSVKENCSSMVSDNDMDKIKRKMFTQRSDNDMVQTALRYVNNKCITTEQVKTLGNLFSSDDGRYNLYDALYKYAYDYGNYASLENQMIDPYYKKRFEVMLR